LAEPSQHPGNYDRAVLGSVIGSPDVAGGCSSRQSGQERQPFGPFITSAGMVANGLPHRLHVTSSGIVVCSLPGGRSRPEVRHAVRVVGSLSDCHCLGVLVVLALDDAGNPAADTGAVAADERGDAPGWHRVDGPNQRVSVLADVGADLFG